MPLLRVDSSGRAAKTATQADGPGARAHAKAKEQHMKKLMMSIATLMAVTTVAKAHPGEHAFSMAQSLFHLLTEPDHLAMMAAAAALAAVLWFKLRKRA
jgi:hydrogenase/urease accessory protein HupE